MSFITQNKFKKFSKMTLKLCEALKLPLYRSRYSNKIFTNFQKLFLYVYKQEKKLTYRELEEDLYDSKVPEYLGLKRIPRWTTIQEFVSTLDSLFFEKLILSCANLVDLIGKIAGIDSTGMSLERASHHYCMRIGRKKPVKGFLTLQVLSDLDNQVIRSVRIHKKRMHDSRHLIPLWNKGKHKDIEIFVADKGYDAEKNAAYLMQQEVIPLIAIKNLEIPVSRTKGRIRKRFKECFDWGVYFNRSKCETIFSVLKRKYGSTLRSRTLQTQKIEILTNILVYNINKVIDAFVRLYSLTIRIWSEPNFAKTL